MNVVFQLRFHTKFGQDLFLRLPSPIPGVSDASGLIALQYKDPETWEGSISVAGDQLAEFSAAYNYMLREPDGSTVLDWGEDRRLDLAGFRAGNLKVVDSWNYAGFYQNAFYTEPFQQVLLKGMQAHVPPRNSGVVRAGNAGSLCRFSVKAPLLAKTQTLCLVGSSPELGNWSTTDPILLSRSPEDPCCRVDILLDKFPVEYRYGVYDYVSNTFVRFEDGRNRVLPAPGPETELTIINDGFADLPSTTWKGAGVAIPVFSLRSEKSFGVGEFADLKLLTDWCVSTGLQLIQILPVNDTGATRTWRDSYPYSAISAFALHPMYLRLEDIVADPKSRVILGELEPERKRLNALDDLDYEAVTHMKADFIRKIFPLEKEAVFASGDYQAFFEANDAWLRPYAVFCCLRDKYNTSDFNTWPKCRTYNEAEAASIAMDPEFREEIDQVCFVQYHLHKQLEAAASYAHERGVILKGDIPIGVYRYGVDAWQAPQLYHSDMQAGAPPDAFAVKGQNWSFPTYNWPRMQQDGFAWWKQRFSQMSRYFDAFRIDHILGFFRIWSIPLDAVEGILGYFVPALPIRGGEFVKSGIPFDRARYVEPFITDEVLAELFGAEVGEAKARFFEQDRFGRCSLKPEFATQRQVESALKGNDPRTSRLRQGLFDVISNVILLDIDEAGDEFHFRFAMQDTLSFKALPPDLQSRLQDLYIDYFFRRQDAFWMREALKKLPALKSVTNMLVCGEDLGLVPACVPQVMKDLGLLSLEIQRMPKDSGTEFFNPADAPYLSVVMPSTHDMSTIRGWWEEDPARTQRFYNLELRMAGPAPAKCDPAINEAILLQHLESPAMWSIFMIQDLLGADARLRHPNPEAERINVPANPQHYWRYRMRVPMETLIAENAFNERLRSAVERVGRASVI